MYVIVIIDYYNIFDISSEAVDGIVNDALASLNLNTIDYTSLLQSCVNADPNYGVIWFHCKKRPFDTARRVFHTAKDRLTEEILAPKGPFPSKIATHTNTLRLTFYQGVHIAPPDLGAGHPTLMRNCTEFIAAPHHPPFQKHVYPSLVAGVFLGNLRSRMRN